jgi:cobalamin synthase
MLAGMRALSMRQIGGQTGDVCGAVQVLTELTMLTVYVATIG